MINDKRKLGEILLDKKVINQEQLDIALAKQKYQKGKSIGEILVEMDDVSQEKVNTVMDQSNKRQSVEEILVAYDYVMQLRLDEIKQKHPQKGVAFAKLLSEYGVLTPKALMHVLSKHYILPIVSLSNENISKKVQEGYVNKSGGYAFKNKVIFLGNENDKILRIAVANPNQQFLNDISNVISSIKPKKFYLASQEDIEYTISYLSRDNNKTNSFTFDKMGLIYNEHQQKYKEKVHHNGAKVAPEAIELQNKYLTSAITEGASDAHLEPTYDSNMKLNGGIMRIRQDGVLLQSYRIESLGEYMSLISSFKIRAKMDIAEKRRVQDGRFGAQFRNLNGVKDFDFRVSVIPVSVADDNVQREGMVIRLLDHDKGNLELADLGFSNSLKFRFEELLKSPDGMVLVTGATGSGKSTTLHTALKAVNDSTKKVVSVEDPIEYRCPGVLQTDLNDCPNETFASVLRGYLRHDPDIIRVGEIRDEETAEMAIKAVQTGHLLLSTLHTRTATGTISRIKELGLDPEVFMSYTSGILGQKLVRKICLNCIEQYQPDPKNIEKFFGKSLIPPKKYYHGAGCHKCNDLGYTGRITLSELWTPDYHELESINEIDVPAGKSPYDYERKIRQNAVLNHGFKTFYDDAVNKLRSNKTTIEELIRVMPNVIEDRKLYVEFVQQLRVQKQVKTYKSK